MRKTESDRSIKLKVSDYKSGSFLVSHNHALKYYTSLYKALLGSQRIYVLPMGIFIKGLFRTHNKEVGTSSVLSDVSFIIKVNGQRSHGLTTILT